MFIVHFIFTHINFISRLIIISHMLLRMLSGTQKQTPNTTFSFKAGCYLLWACRYLCPKVANYSGSYEHILREIRMKGKVS